MAQILIQHFGPRANPEQAVRLRCVDIASLIETVQASDAILVGVVTVARNGIAAGSLVELVITPPLRSGTRFALITRVGRTEAPAMALFRRFVAEHLHD